MKRIPPRPDLGQLKKQAKELLALYRQGDPAAKQRLRESLPAARGKLDDAGDAWVLSHDAGIVSPPIAPVAWESEQAARAEQLALRLGNVAHDVGRARDVDEVARRRRPLQQP